MASLMSRLVSKAMKSALEKENDPYMTPEQVLAQRNKMDKLGGIFRNNKNTIVKDSDKAEIPGYYFQYNGKGAQKQSEKILLYFHGGGFENGTAKSRQFLVSWISAKGKMNAYSMEYTQWPEGRYPSALNEAMRAFEALQAEGYEPQNIQIGGESAGAILTLQLALALKAKGIPTGKLILLGPVFSMSTTFPARTANLNREPVLSGKAIDVMLAHYFEGTDPNDPMLSFDKADLSGLSEVFISVGTEEILYDDAVELHRSLDKCGVKNTLKIYPGMAHTFQTLPFKESKKSCEDIGQFLLA